MTSEDLKLETVTLTIDEISLISNALACYVTYLHSAGVHNDNLTEAKAINTSLSKTIALFERLAEKL